MRWNSARAKSLDEIENAHTAVGGTGPGRRYATLQVNHAFAVLLASQFQGYCRDLHTECVDVIVASIQPRSMSQVVSDALTLQRRLDHGNATMQWLNEDFGRFGVDFEAAAKRHSARTPDCIAALNDLLRWRNAIAHQNFAKLRGNAGLHLHSVKRWRRACGTLARTFDAVMRGHYVQLFGNAPW